MCHARKSVIQVWKDVRMSNMYAYVFFWRNKTDMEPGKWILSLLVSIKHKNKMFSHTQIIKAHVPVVSALYLQFLA